MSDKIIKIINIDSLKYYNDKINQTKQDVLISGQNIKTINGESIIGSGNIEIISGNPDANVQAVDIEGVVVDDVAIELIPLTNSDIDLIWNKYFNEGGYGSGSATAVDEVINSVGVGDYDEEIL